MHCNKNTNSSLFVIYISFRVVATHQGQIQDLLVKEGQIEQYIRHQMQRAHHYTETKHLWIHMVANIFMKGEVKAPFDPSLNLPLGIHYTPYYHFI